MRPRLPCSLPPPSIAVDIWTIENVLWRENVLVRIVRLLVGVAFDPLISRW